MHKVALPEDRILATHTATLQRMTEMCIFEDLFPPKKPSEGLFWGMVRSDFILPSSFYNHWL